MAVISMDLGWGYTLEGNISKQQIGSFAGSVILPDLKCQGQFFGVQFDTWNEQVSMNVLRQSASCHIGGKTNKFV
jgi:hypothetical protein